MSSRSRSFCNLTVILALAAVLVSRGVMAAGPTLSNARIGIRGQFQVGAWTSFEADIESDSWPVQLTVVVPDPDGNLIDQPAAKIEKQNQSTAHVRTLFKTGRLSDTVRIELRSPESKSEYVLHPEEVTGEPVDVEFTLPWRASTQFWAVLGEAEPFQTAADRIIDREAQDRPSVRLIELDDADDLPLHADALDSLQVLAIIGPQEIPAAISDAIRRWVADGGHLILSIARPEDFSSLSVSDWLPMQAAGQSRLRDLSSLTTQVPGSVPIRVDTVDALRFDFDHGETLASTLDGPLWARLPYGFGSVSILGIDMSRRPLVDWSSLPQLCERLTDYQRLSDQTQQKSGTQLSQTGVTELQTQLALGLDQFEQVDKVSNWLAMGLILAYLVLIGPLDYLIVHKLLKRPHWTWITFPAMVLLGIGFASMTAAARNPTQTLANQVDLVDVDLASRSAHIHSWMSFTSPASRRYDVTAASTNELVDISAADSSNREESEGGSSVRVSWTGIPEAGFRGMYRTGGLDLAQASYETSVSRDELIGLPVAIWSSANMTARIEGPIDSPERILISDLETEASQLSGTITNQLSVPLEDWLVAHEGRVYLPQTRIAGAAALNIAPGETIDFTDGRRVVPRVLQSYLTGVRRVMVSSRNTSGEDVVATRDAYNPLDRDPYATLRIVSFFEASNGDDFTALTNHAMENLDLSRLLPLGRAVLFCRVRTPAAVFSLDGRPVETSEHETIFRVVLPVRER